MAHYAAFDVSDKETAIHVLDAHGRLVWKGKRPSEPEALTAALRRHAPELERVGLETGQLAPWLYHSLKALGVPVVCLDARHARAATALQRNKTDARDAETLAQLVRMGWYREARVKGWALDRGLIEAAKGDATCRLLMTCPGVGVVSRPASARPRRRLATSNVHGRSAPTSACSAHQRRTQASPPGRGKWADRGNPAARHDDPHRKARAGRAAQSPCQPSGERSGSDRAIVEGKSASIRTIGLARARTKIGLANFVTTCAG